MAKQSPFSLDVEIERAVTDADDARVAIATIAEMHGTREVLARLARLAGIQARLLACERARRRIAESKLVLLDPMRKDFVHEDDGTVTPSDLAAGETLP